MPTMPARRSIAVVAYDGVQLLDVTGPVEVFTTANACGARYDVAVVAADARPVLTGAGLRIVPDGTFDAPGAAPDVVVVPGAEDWASSLRHAAVARYVARAAAGADRTVGVCAGAFLLADAGLLDGRRATTHWRLTGELRERFPAVAVEDDPIFVADGRVWTTAGVTAGIDACLALVEEDHGAVLARAVARELVVFMQRPGGQAQFSARLRRQAALGDPLRALLDDIAADPAADHRLERLAEHAGFSARHLSRVFRREVGTTPAEYVEEVRVEAARTLLEGGDASLDVVARRSGLGSAETLRRAFARHLGTTPAAYRERFATTGRAAA
jgi:transcriptional regulator GlxA family with amidase domain